MRRLCAGSVFSLPAAVDRDHGPLDVQSYSMTSNATDQFRLRHVTGTGSASDVQLVVAGRLDRETQSVYTATVTAVDGGNPAKSGSLDVLILIQVCLTDSVFTNGIYRTGFKQRSYHSSHLI